MEKENHKIIAEFIKQMHEKYPQDKDSKIFISVEGNELIVYQNTPIKWESDYWDELEKIKIT